MKRRMQPVRGTHDHLFEDRKKFEHIVSTAHNIAESYGYYHMDTPIFEFSDVFKKSLGDSSDIVSKEMYTFIDRSNEEITLRPEGTAGIIRAIISNGLTHQMPFKTFYSGPMFRYERPQKGRLRQFHQIGIEHIGNQNPESDIEVIACGNRILKKLKINEVTKLHINSLGDIEERKKFKNVLTEYLKKYKNKLSKDSINRLYKNPLRILDSKNEEDIQILTNAPKMQDFLKKESKENFKNVLDGIKSLGIKFEVDNNLVRGLDYYGHTTFEFITTELGSQGAVLAGGRYNDLMKQMGGPDLSGIGWASGIERLMLLTNPPILKPKKVCVIPIGNKYSLLSLKIAENIREIGITTNISFNGNLKKGLSYANKLQSNFAIMIGEEEAKTDCVMIKNLTNGIQEKLKINDLTNYFLKI